MKIIGRPISKKRSYKRSKYGGLYLDNSYRKWQQDALWQLKQYKERYTGQLSVEYTFQVKGRAIFDLDNAIVGINDILQDAEIIENDKQIVAITAHKYYGFKDYMTIVEINQATNQLTKGKLQ